MESPLQTQDKRILQNQQTIKNKPNLFESPTNYANRAKQVSYESAYCPPTMPSAESPRVIGKKSHSVPHSSTPIVKSSQNRNKNIHNAASCHDNVMINNDGSQYQSPRSQSTKQTGIKIGTMARSTNKPFEYTLSKQQNYITQLEKKVISQHKEITELRNVREKPSRSINIQIQSNANSSNVSTTNSTRDTSIIITKQRSKCLQNTYIAVSYAVTILNVLKKLMALFSTAFLIDCKFTKHGGHLGIECTQEHTVKHIEDFATHHTFVIRNNGERIAISELNQMDYCYLPSCSAMHPKELEVIKRTKHNEYLKVIGNPCDRQDAICGHSSSDSKCGTMTRYSKNIQDWYTPVWWLENRSYLDPLAEGNAKHERYIDCKTGNECCAFYIMPDIKEDFWRDNVSDDLLKKYCYLTGISSSMDTVRHVTDHFFSSVNRLTWSEAKEFCKNNAGNLAVIRNQKQFDEAVEVASAHGTDYSYQMHWLGITDIETEGFYRDINGDLMSNVYGFESDGSISSSKASKPWYGSISDSSTLKQDTTNNCLVIQKNDSISWHNPPWIYSITDCGKRRYPLCQWGMIY